MSLDKAVEHGKEYRKGYYKSARFDKTCRPGSHWANKCPYCLSNRQHGNKRRALAAREQIKECVCRAFHEVEDE